MAYNTAAKGAIISLTKALAFELGPVGEIAATCAFLCSEDAGYVTDQTHGVNGGYYM